MGGLGKLFKKAKFVKDNYSALNAIQNEMKKVEVTGSAGRDAVIVVMDGSTMVRKVTINPDLCKPSEVEKLQRFIMEAVNDASIKSKKAMEGTMKTMASSMNLDGLKDML